MQDSNPLLSVFSEDNLAKLEKGLDTLPKPKADDRISCMLTDPSNRDAQLALAAWFKVAEQKCCGNHYRERLTNCFRDWAAFLQVRGELMAGWFLYSKLDKEVDYRCAQEGADFRLTIGGSLVNCEVKTAVGGIRPGRYFGPGIPTTPKIRSWLGNIASQLDKDTANIVLFVDCWRPGISPDYIFDALYGSKMIEIPVQLTPGEADPLPEPRFVRLRNGKLRPEQLTRVSAVGVLRFVPLDGEWRMQAWFVHNLHAAKPIPPLALDPHPQLEPLADRAGLRWRRGIGSNGLPIEA